MFGKLGRCLGLGLLAILLVFSAARLAAAINPNERSVKPEANAQDSDDIRSPTSKVWVLDFKFKDPRLIKVNVPGRGQKVCWYLWYQVINKTAQPHTFIPDFELVTTDRNTVHHDQILPKVQDAVRQLEDPTDYLKIKNSVTIAAEPIPPSKKDAEPHAVTGVAIWDDVDPDANYYTIFVSGLSNGWAVTDDPDKPGEKTIVRRKTLQLNFRRLGDRFNQKSEEIRFVQPPQWIYRGSSLKPPELPSLKEDKKP
ncbi:MAG TPA: hypothetical protein VMG10_12415 [Gemmataceae bacterium]|nr:hypothetical protein [Gemmataceae bacterium]